MPRPRPITDTKIPGTDVPDVSKAEAESSRQKNWMARVAVSTAVMAALAAISTMFSGFHLNEAMIEQIRAGDKWSQYQAKGIKYAVLESRIEAQQALSQSVSKDDTDRLARYKHEQEDIMAEARQREADSETHRHRYKVLSRAATALQIGIALAAVALLLQRNVFWIIALCCALVGAGFLFQGLLLV